MPCHDALPYACEAVLVINLSVTLPITGGVSNVDIDGNNALSIKAIGITISTFETLPHISARWWIQREFFPLAQEPAFFGHFVGVEPEFTGIFSLYCRCRMEKRQSISLPRASMASRR